TVTITVTNSFGQSDAKTFKVTVGDAVLNATCAAISPIAGAPFNGTVASFTDANPSPPLSDFTATITWGDGSTSIGTITKGSGGFNVSGSHTYANSGSYTLSVLISDIGGSKAAPSCPINVTSLGIGVQKGQSATIGFWQNQNGQALINSFNS